MRSTERSPMLETHKAEVRQMASSPAFEAALRAVEAEALAELGAVSDPEKVEAAWRDFRSVQRIAEKLRAWGRPMSKYTTRKDEQG